MTTSVLLPPFIPRGAAVRLMEAHDREILIEGPANTGKTYACLHKMHALAIKYPGMRALILRKTQVSLTGSALVTYQKRVLRPEMGVEFFGGSSAEPAAFRYPNGSVVVVGGLDSTTKIYSTEYDFIYVNQVEELTLDEWEELTPRLGRGAGMTMPYQQIIADCNPSHDRHWLYLRCNAGLMLHLKSKHEDNPTMTEEYLEGLRRLHGTRYQRLYLGEWVGAENMIYPQAVRDTMLVSMPERIFWKQGRGAVGEDYGSEGGNLSAVTAVTEDTQGHYWVRECWAEHTADPDKIEQRIASQRIRFKTTWGNVDPLQEFSARKMNLWRPGKDGKPIPGVAERGAGTRKRRIGLVTTLLDAGILFFDKDAEGVPELFEEMLYYHYEIKETSTLIDDVVVRKDDDRVASMEYAIEALRLFESPPVPQSVRLFRGRGRQEQGVGRMLP